MDFAAGIAGLLMHPIAIAICVSFVWFLSSVMYGLYRHHSSKPSSIPPRRLVGGYLGAIVACALIAIVESYVSPQEATTVWHVPADQYWSVELHEFLDGFVLLTYCAIVGIAVVGAPVIFFLDHLGRASILWVLSASIVISLVASLIITIVLVGISHPSDRPVHDFSSASPLVPLLVGTHLFIALGFCLGARLPWQVKSQ